MPRRKRVSKLRADGETVESFLLNSGYGVTLLSGQPTFDSPEEAAEAWELCRLATWNHEWRDPRKPPQGAVSWDGIGRDAIDLLYHGAPAEEVRAAAAADLASVDAFRRERPAAARAIADHLDAYVETVNTAASIAEIPDDVTREEALRRFQTVAAL
jgi:hypothetical protein